MEHLTKTLVKVCEWYTRRRRAQTMTEYALILAAIAIVVYIAYQIMGQDIKQLVNRVNSELTTAS